MVSLNAKFFYLDNAESTYKTGFNALQWVISNTAHTWLVYLLFSKYKLIREARQAQGSYMQHRAHVAYVCYGTCD